MTALPPRDWRSGAFEETVFRTFGAKDAMT